MLPLVITVEQADGGTRRYAFADSPVSIGRNPFAELQLIEPLRTLRMIHYAGWLALRWDDPAFPAAFPWFNTQRYWQDHILALREQAAALDEPALAPAA